MSTSAPSELVLSPAVLTEVGDGMFAYVQRDDTWWVVDTGLPVGERSAVGLFNCATERRSRACAAAVPGWSPRAG